MDWMNVKHILLFVGIGFLSSCSVIDKSSTHGFDSGYYKHSLEKGRAEKVYLDITDDTVAVHPMIENKPGQSETVLPLGKADSLYLFPSRFSKTSLDIDITSVFFKYRPATDELQAQLTAELNVALYAGWRHDYYRIEGKKDPLGKINYTVIKRGFDVGILAGPGTTFVGPSTTKTSITKEYNGMILEYGLAGFLETNFASFGVAVGFDHLLGSDRSVWIYNQKPWIGFVVGIALN